MRSASKALNVAFSTFKIGSKKIAAPAKKLSRSFHSIDPLTLSRLSFEYVGKYRKKQFLFRDAIITIPKDACTLCRGKPLALPGCQSR